MIVASITTDLSTLSISSSVKSIIILASICSKSISLPLNNTLTASKIFLNSPGSLVSAQTTPSGITKISSPSLMFSIYITIVSTNILLSRIIPTSSSVDPKLFPKEVILPKISLTSNSIFANEKSFPNTNLTDFNNDLNSFARSVISLYTITPSLSKSIKYFSTVAYKIFEANNKSTSSSSNSNTLSSNVFGSKLLKSISTLLIITLNAFNTLEISKSQSRSSGITNTSSSSFIDSTYILTVSAKILLLAISSIWSSVNELTLLKTLFTMFSSSDKSNPLIKCLAADKRISSSPFLFSLPNHVSSSSRGIFTSITPFNAPFSLLDKL